MEQNTCHFTNEEGKIVHPGCAHCYILHTLVHHIGQTRVFPCYVETHLYKAWKPDQQISPYLSSFDLIQWRTPCEKGNQVNTYHLTRPHLT